MCINKYSHLISFNTFHFNGTGWKHEKININVTMPSVTGPLTKAAESNVLNRWCNALTAIDSLFIGINRHRHASAVQI